MGMEKITNFVWGSSPSIPTHPHVIFLHGDVWGNAWGGFAWVSETRVFCACLNVCLCDCVCVMGRRKGVLFSCLKFFVTLLPLDNRPPPQLGTNQCLWKSQPLFIPCPRSLISVRCADLCPWFTPHTAYIPEFRTK